MTLWIRAFGLSVARLASRAARAPALAVAALAWAAAPGGFAQQQPLALAVTTPYIAYYNLTGGSTVNLFSPSQASSLQTQGVQYTPAVAPAVGEWLHTSGWGPFGGSGSRISTDLLAALNPQAFGLVVEFNTTVTRNQPIIVGGPGALWFEVNVIGSELGVTMNNGAVSARWSGTAIAANTWYRIAVQTDLANRQVHLSINGSSVRSLTLPPGFTLELFGLPRGIQDDQKRFVFSNDRTSTAFTGKLRALQVFPAVALDTLPARSRPTNDPAAVQEFAFPVISTRSVGMGRFLLNPTSPFGLETGTSSLTPGVCTMSGNMVSLVSSGQCVLSARQGEMAAGFNQSCSTAYSPFCSCVQTTCVSTPIRTAETRSSFAVTGETGTPPPPQNQFVLNNGTIADNLLRVFATGTNRSLTVSTRLTLSGVQFAQAIAGGVKVFVFAYIPAVGTITAPVLLQKAPSGDWGPLALPLAVYMENVSVNAVDNSVLIEIIASNDFSNLVGTEFYVGYGTSDAEMVQARRYRGIYKVVGP